MEILMGYNRPLICFFNPLLFQPDTTTPVQIKDMVLTALPTMQVAESCLVEQTHWLKLVHTDKVTSTFLQGHAQKAPDY